MKDDTYPVYFLKGIFDIDNGETTNDTESDPIVKHEGYNCRIRILKDVKSRLWHAQFVFLVPEKATFYVITRQSHLTKQKALCYIVNFAKYGASDARFTISNE